MRCWEASTLALKMFDTFSDLSESDLKVIADSSELRHYRPGEFVTKQGEKPTHVHFIISGAIKLTRRIQTQHAKTEYMQDVIVQMFGRGEAIGDAGLYHDFEFKGNLTAVNECETLSINRSILAEVTLSTPLILLNLYNRTSSKFLKCIEGVDLSYGKLLDRIEYLAEECEKVGINLFKHFSKTEIAKMLGVSRVSVSNCINEPSSKLSLVKSSIDLFEF